MADHGAVQYTKEQYGEGDWKSWNGTYGKSQNGKGNREMEWEIMEWYGKWKSWNGMRNMEWYGKSEMVREIMEWHEKSLNAKENYGMI